MFFDAYIGYDRTDEEMKDRHCTCPETGTPDEYGDGSSLPCMSDMNGLGGFPDLCCRNCIYCTKK